MTEAIQLKNLITRSVSARPTSCAFGLNDSKMQSDKLDQSFRKQLLEKSPTNIINIKKNLNDLKYVLRQKNQEIEQLK